MRSSRLIAGCFRVDTRSARNPAAVLSYGTMRRWMFAIDDLHGATLDGKYQISRLLGQGGMGAVFAAEHRGTGRTVAVKIVLPQLLRHPEALERFRREARAAGGLRHPNIVDVTDFGVARVGQNEIAYLVMEYLEGTTLRAFMQSQGRISPPVMVAIVEQIALALEAAHRAGMVHRDLKPDNVWLIPDPRGGHIVRVLDFGLAKLREPAPPPIAAGAAAIEAAAGMAAPLIAHDAPTLYTPDPGDPDAQPTLARSAAGSVAALSDGGALLPLTISGSTLGTPAYMSPEQCRGEAVDDRSDIYSLGVLTYEALAGKRPFAGTFSELIDAHLHGTPEPLDRVAPVRPRLAQAVARALAKSPEERYPSARAMAGSLYAALEGGSAILRRSAALFADRFPLFIRIAAHAFVTASLPMALLPLAAAVSQKYWIAIVPLAAIFCWGIMTPLTNTAFAVAIDRLRMRPLDTMTVTDVYDELERRLGFPRNVSRFRSALRLMGFYIRTELRAPAGAGDLAFLIRFMEEKSRSEAAERCRLLLPGIRGSYDWIRGMLVACLLLIPIGEGCIAFAVATMFHLKNAQGLALVIASLLIPVNAIVLNPIFSSALALLYFRARQANGEDVALSSVLSTGV